MHTTIQLSTTGYYLKQLYRRLLINTFLKKITSSKHIPWINNHIKHLRKRLYDKAKRKQTPKTWEAYWKIRNKVIQAIEDAHGDYQEQLFDTESNTVSKEFWKYIKGLCKDRTGVASLKVKD